MECPLCHQRVPTLALLEEHLRRELGYTAFRCLLCPLQFFKASDAEAHFEGRFSPHPDVGVAYADQRNAILDAKLSELLDRGEV